MRGPATRRSPGRSRKKRRVGRREFQAIVGWRSGHDVAIDSLSGASEPLTEKARNAAGSFEEPGEAGLRECGWRAAPHEQALSRRDAATHVKRRKKVNGGKKETSNARAAEVAIVGGENVTKKRRSSM